MIYIDFDDTLFDTVGLKKKLLTAAKFLGVEEKDFWLAYELAKGCGGEYNICRHAEELQKLGHKKKEVEEKLNEAMKDLSGFVFEDAKIFLQNLQSFGRPVLLSLGEESFQNFKIFGSSLRPYFSEVVIISKSKLDYLMGQSKENGWIINDKIEETKKIINSLPNLKAVLKMSPEAEEDKYKKSGLPYFSNFKEVEDYVRNN